MPTLEDLIRQRRAALGDPGLPPGADRIWGLALSGGGIRSATFCLGLLRALAVRQMLLRFDLVSTVSGGGFIGSTLGRLFSRAKDADGVRAVAEAVADADARWFTWWLRANGRYLVPRGVKDRSFAFALYLRNLTGVHFELGLLALLLGVALAALDAGGWALARELGYRVGGPFFSAVRFLPDWVPVVAFLLPVAVAFGGVAATAYWCLPWLVKTGRVAPGGVLGLWLVVLAAVLALLGLRVPLDRVQTDVGETLRALLWWGALMLMTTWIFAVPVAWRVLQRTRDEPEMRLREEAGRNRLTRWLANCFRAGGVIALLGAVDRFAWFLAFEWRALGRTGVALGVVAAVMRAVLPAVSAQLQGRRSRDLTLAVGRVVGYALTFLLCCWWVSLVYRAALGATFQRVSPNFADAFFLLGAIGGPVALYELLTGGHLDFLNLSSLHGFYRARLVRSYLGAANGRRFDGAHADSAIRPLPCPMPVRPAHVSVDDLEREDDIAFADYAPHAHGGPLHLLNVCVNQTRDPRGGLFNQDRRGLSMTVCSGGLLRLAQDDWRPMTGPGALTLGAWTAISGAAVAPGLGSLTRGGISALATFAGLRLGFWWDEGTRENEPTKRSPLVAKSAGLLRETFGSFRGTERPDWFLTDGGHFENTGAYALLAERAEVIVLADCGADPAYAFGDIENLVRKARIDLQAEILFQRPRVRPETVPPAPWPEEMEFFGSLNDLASSRSSACLALARIRYEGTRAGNGILVVVKPNVADGLPVDLVNFKAQNPEFPQQSTADQFFSEAQWESYYQLGQFLGGRLTPAFVEHLVSHWSDYFEHDEQSPFEDDGADVAADAAAATPQGRLPSRVATTAVGATLGLGAVATLGVTAWQALDSVRGNAARRTAEERSALKELTDLWAKLPPPAATPDAASAGELAAAIVRTADTLCPAGEAGWFRDSPLANTVYQNALAECAQLAPDAMPRACTTLLEAANPRLQTTLPNCLVRPEAASKAVPPPHYWLYDYSESAPWARAHPCDPAAAARRRADELYRSGRLSLAGLDEQLDDGSASLPPDCRSQDVDVGAWIHQGWTIAAARWTGGGVASPPSLPGLPGAASPTTPSAVTPLPPPPPAPGSTTAAPPPEATAGAEPGEAPGTRPAAVPAPVPSAALSPHACARATVYVQLYGPSQRDDVVRWRLKWQQLGATVPPAEDVLATARAAGRVPPLRVAGTTLRVHDPSLGACARAMATAAGHADWTIEPLSPRLKPSPGVIEVWVRPAAGLRDYE